MLADPRFALFGLTLLSHKHPNLLKEIDTFNHWLRQTGESLCAIHSAVSNYEASMLAINSPKTQEEQVNQQPPFDPLANNRQQFSKATEQMLTRISEAGLDQLETFLDEFNQLILKYGNKNNNEIP